MIVLLELEFISDEDYQQFWNKSIQPNKIVVDCQELGKYKGTLNPYEEEEEDE